MFEGFINVDLITKLQLCCTSCGFSSAGCLCKKVGHLEHIYINIILTEM